MKQMKNGDEERTKKLRKIEEYLDREMWLRLERARRTDDIHPGDSRYVSNYEE